MDQLRLLSRDSVLVGGTAITVMLGSAVTSRKSYPCSPDIDVAMSEQDVAKLGRRLNETATLHNMVDHVHIEMGSGISVRKRLSPFTFLRFGESDMDIFTPQTGIGPISVDDRLFGNAVEYTLGDLKLKVAQPSFIIATTMNPLAATDHRIMRSFLIIFDFSAKCGNDALFEGVMKPAIGYMKEGIEKVRDKVDEIRSHNGEKSVFGHILSNHAKNYTRYLRYLTTSLPNRLEVQTGKIANFATRMGIGTERKNEELVAGVEKLLRASG
jgi:hypothetical protein